MCLFYIIDSLFMGIFQISGKSAVFMLIMSSYVIVLFVSIFFY